MVNILLEGYDIAQPWLRDGLGRYLRAGQKAAVVAFSFNDRKVRNLDDWNRLYSREAGKYYAGIVRGFMEYGLREEDVCFINYFADTHEEAWQKAAAADILYFLGGLPDRMMERIDEFGLREAMLGSGKLLMGYSAGALIQLAEYHLAPDDDYPDFVYFKGLSCLDSFYHQVHYEETDVQNAAIQRVLAERGKTVYATAFQKGAIIVDDGRVTLLGDVKVFQPT